MRSKQTQRVGDGRVSDVTIQNNLEVSLILAFSEKGFSEPQREDPKLRSFMKNLAHFTLNNLNDLLNDSENFFNVDDYLDVNLRIAF